MKGNPCKGVRQFKEMSHERYVTDAEYDTVYTIAPITVKIAMKIAYLCCARQSVVLALCRAQILEPGIFTCQGKTGSKQIKAWPNRLRVAMVLADTLPIKDGISSVYVIHQRDGFNTQWRNAKLAAIAPYPEIDFDFTYHDLKAKGISNLDGTLTEKQAISGHKSIGQTARYDRKN